MSKIQKKFSGCNCLAFKNHLSVCGCMNNRATSLNQMICMISKYRKPKKGVVILEANELYESFGLVI